MFKTFLLRATQVLAGLLAPTLLVAQAASFSPELSSGASVDQSQNPHRESKVLFPEGVFALPNAVRYLLWADLENGELHLIERLAAKEYQLLQTIPVSIGKQGYPKEMEGDKKTPLGLYRVTSFIPETELTDFYGLGAYPINYPNNWDRLQNRTGYGIWLHGLPKGVNERPLLDSDGCVVMDNQSLSLLDNFISPGETLVVLANELQWQTAESDTSEADALLNTISAWQKDWESLDAAAYLDNYHPEYQDFRRDLAAPLEYKTLINRRKSFIKVSLSKLSALRYPGTEDLVSTRFYQDYKSSNYDWSGWKELLWKKDSDGRWKILLESEG